MCTKKYMLLPKNVQHILSVMVAVVLAWCKNLMSLSMFITDVTTNNSIIMSSWNLNSLLYNLKQLTLQWLLVLVMNARLQYMLSKLFIDMTSHFCIRCAYIQSIKVGFDGKIATSLHRNISITPNSLAHYTFYDPYLRGKIMCLKSFIK